jgi:hypothetical protein
MASSGDWIIVNPTPESLMALLRFTADDLAQNRVGRLSPQQIADATRAAVGSALLFLLVVAVVLVVVFVVRPRGVALVFYSLMLTGSLAVFGMMAAAAIAARVQLRVESVQGPIQILGARRSSVLAIGRRRFSISENAGRALRAGDHYRVFGLAHTSTLLSLERLPQGEGGHAGP